MLRSAFMLILVLAGCEDDRTGRDASSGRDVGPIDSTPDAGQLDAEQKDADPSDADPVDGSPTDGAIDAGETTDAGGIDASDPPLDGGIGWARIIGGDGWDQAGGIAVVGSEVIVAGQVEGTLDVGCGALNAQYRDIFMAAFGAIDGACAWSRIYGTPNHDRADALAVGSSGELYLAGYFNDFGDAMLDLGGGALAGQGSNRNIPFVARFDLTNGPVHGWSIRFLGDGTVTRLAPHSGGVVAAGHFYQSLTVNGQNVTRCCQDGDAAWIASISAGNADWGSGARITSEGIDSVYPGALAIVGSEAWLNASAAETAEIGATSIPAGPFAARFALSGGALAGVTSVSASSGDPIFVWRMIEDPGGFIVAGTAYEGADLGNGPLVGFGAHIFVGRIDAALQLLDVQTFHIEHGGISGLERDAAGRVIVIGAFRGTRSFGGFTLTSGSQIDFTEDPFVMMLSPDLDTVLHAESFFTPGEDFLGGLLTLSPSGSWIVAQHFVESIEVRGQTFNGPSGWNVLLFELR